MAYQFCAFFYREINSEIWNVWINEPTTWRQCEGGCCQHCFSPSRVNTSFQQAWSQRYIGCYSSWKFTFFCIVEYEISAYDLFGVLRFLTTSNTKLAEKCSTYTHTQNPGSHTLCWRYTLLWQPLFYGYKLNSVQK